MDTCTLMLTIVPVILVSFVSCTIVLLLGGTEAKVQDGLIVDLINPRQLQSASSFQAKIMDIGESFVAPQRHSWYNSMFVATTASL